MPILDDIALEVCNELEIPLRDFRMAIFRSPELSIARRLFCLIAREERVGTLAERAAALGSTNTTMPCKWASQGEQRVKARDDYQRAYRSVMANLTEPVGGAT